MSSENPVPAKSGAAPWWLMIAAFAVVMGLTALIVFQMQRSGPLAAGQVGAGAPPPDFTLTTFDQKQTHTLSALRGKVVVVNFWASWCTSCEVEAADLEQAWQTYKDKDVLFLGVDYADTETEALAYLQRFGVTYPNGPDLGTRISQSYRVRGAPETYVVDKTGVLAVVMIGPIEPAEFSRLIESLLK